MTAEPNTFGAFVSFISPQRIGVDNVRFTCSAMQFYWTSYLTLQKIHSFSVIKAIHKL
jgi:hypothetical protein